MKEEVVKVYHLSDSSTDYDFSPYAQEEEVSVYFECAVERKWRPNFWCHSSAFISWLLFCYIFFELGVDRLHFLWVVWWQVTCSESGLWQVTFSVSSALAGCISCESSVNRLRFSVSYAVRADIFQYCPHHNCSSKYTFFYYYFCLVLMCFQYCLL